MEIITSVAIKIEKIPYQIANKIVHLIQIANFGHFVNQNKEGTKGSASWKPKGKMLQKMQILHLGPKIVICLIKGQVCHQEGIPHSLWTLSIIFSKNIPIFYLFMLYWLYWFTFDLLQQSCNPFMAKEWLTCQISSVCWVRIWNCFFRRIVMSINYSTSGDPSEFQLHKY